MNKGLGDLIRNACVQIHSDPENRTFGTGFVFAQFSHGALVLTCAHVIENSETRDVVINGHAGEIVFSGSKSDLDLSIIYVSDFQAKAVLKISDTIIQDSSALCFGYQKISETLIGKIVPLKVNGIGHKYGVSDSVLLFDISTDSDRKLFKGYSGGPVVNEKGEVIGIVSHKSSDSDTGYMIASTNLVSTIKNKDLLTNYLLDATFNKEVRAYENLEVFIKEGEGYKTYDNRPRNLVPELVFNEENNWINLIKVGRWRRKGENIIGKGMFTYLLSSYDYPDADLTILIDLWIEYKPHNLGIGLGIIIGYVEINNRKRYLNICFTGEEIFMEYVGNDGKGEMVGTHLSKKQKCLIDNNSDVEIRMKIQDRVITIFVNNQYFIFNKPKNIVGKIGLRPWRSTVLISNFEIFS